MKKFALIFLATCLWYGCSNENATPEGDPGSAGNGTLGNGQRGVVGLSGIDAWDKVSASEKARIKSWTTVFMHQSVGGDLEDGAEANGFKFEYFDLSIAPRGLSGNVFSTPNGDPMGKITEFKKNVIAHKTTVKLAIFKFGYADINDTNRDDVKTAYKQLIDELRAQVPGIRFVHITPPLITIVAKDEGNAAKVSVGQWMKSTFGAKDVVFDLQEIESNNGACKLGTVLTLCPENRSTAACPSKNQGIDATEGQGHLCEKAAARISKGFLMSIYNSGR